MANQDLAEKHKLRERFQNNKQAQLPQISLERNVTIQLRQLLLKKIFIYKGSITNLKHVTAIVNPANERLWADGSGVCGVIFSMAGYNDLQAECNSITSKTKNKRIPTGQTVITNAYNLNAKYILHTVAPPSQYTSDLISCYISSMELCVINNIKSVAFPCIATGDGNFNKQVACNIALKSVRGWLCDASNVKYSDFMNKVAAKKLNKNIKIPNINNHQNDIKNNDNDDDDIFQIQETVFDRIDNVIFCCFDNENWNIYQNNISQIFPPSSLNSNHSYNYIDKPQQIINKSVDYNTFVELKQEWKDKEMKLKNEIQRLTDENDDLLQENEDLVQENDELQQKLQINQFSDQKNDGNNDIQCILTDFNKYIIDFKNKYNKKTLTNIRKMSPISLMDYSHKSCKININNEIKIVRDCLQNIRVKTNLFNNYIQNISNIITSISNPIVSDYKNWLLDDIIIWILKLENGKYIDYISQIKIGIIESEITGDMLPELTRSDLSSPPFNIKPFIIKRDLVKHFISLKYTKTNEGNAVTSLM